MGYMLLVTGGSGSGKSEYAEQRILESGFSLRYYVATMEVFGEEGRKRVEKHGEDSEKEKDLRRWSSRILSMTLYRTLQKTGMPQFCWNACLI